MAVEQLLCGGFSAAPPGRWGQIEVRTSKWHGAMSCTDFLPPFYPYNILLFPIVLSCLEYSYGGEGAAGAYCHAHAVGRHDRLKKNSKRRGGSGVGKLAPE